MVVTIDCANDYDLATELCEFLQNNQFGPCKLLDAKVTIERRLAKEEAAGIMRLFIEKTKRKHYDILQVDSKNLVLAIKRPIEEFGFKTCELCGFVTPYDEELLVHRRTHIVF